MNPGVILLLFVNNRRALTSSPSSHDFAVDVDLKVERGWVVTVVNIIRRPWNIQCYFNFAYDVNL